MVSARQQSRCNTFPSSLASKPLLYGPGLDDIDDVGSAFSSMRISNEQLTMNPLHDTDSDVHSIALHDTHMCDSDVMRDTVILHGGNINSSSSAPNLQEIQPRRHATVQNPLLDTQFISKRKFLERRQRSFSEDDVMEVSKMYQGVYKQQSSVPHLAAACNTGVLWKTGMLLF